METLIELLKSCEGLLDKVGEKFWSKKIKLILKRNNGELNNFFLQEIISWYGGMGSFNDLIISVYNDHSVEKDNEEKINDELNKLRNKIYKHAKYLLR
jgi:hypothetical protein